MLASTVQFSRYGRELRSSPRCLLDVVEQFIRATGPRPKARLPQKRAGPAVLKVRLPVPSGPNSVSGHRRPITAFHSPEGCTGGLGASDAPIDVPPMSDLGRTYACA